MSERDPRDKHILCCRMHGLPVPYIEHKGVIVPCPWPECSNGTSRSVLEMGDVIFSRCRVGERWAWAETTTTEAGEMRFRSRRACGGPNR